jgi:hypothetical protein
MQVMRHRKKGSKVGNMKELFLKISVSQCISMYYYSVIFILEFNPLPVQFKSLLPGQEGCIFFSGHLNTRTCHYVLLR